MTRHCKGIVKREGVSETTNQHGTTTKQITQMSFIPEGDVYRLIVSSKLPSAERFERWVFDEVLPTIRRHGLYAIDDIIADPDLGIRALLALKAEREARKALEVENKVKDQQSARTHMY